MISKVRLNTQRAILAMCIGFISTISSAEDLVSSPPSPKFTIQTYQIVGNTILTDAELSAAYSNFVGDNKDFTDIQRALEKIQDLYLAKGYSSVRVSLPEQELENGTVTIEVKEQSIVNLTTEGAEHHTSENILASLPSLRVGQLPNSKALARNLKLANENPSKQTLVLFKANEEDTGVDAVVKVVDEKPWKFFTTADNTGTKETGYTRIGFGFQHYNALDKDQRFSAQFITNSPTDKDLFNVKIFGFGYSIPLYSLGDSIDLSLGYSDVNAGSITLPGTTAGLSVTGRGLVSGAKYNHNFDKFGNYQHRLSLGFDFRAYRNQVDLNGISLQEPVTSSPLSLTYSGQWQTEQQALSFSLTEAVNMPFSSHSGANTYAGYAADRNFSKILYAIDYSRPFIYDWRVRVGMSGQSSNDHLISGEQFGAGGMDSVRGFRDRVISGDKGYRWVAETISPDFGKKLVDNLALRGVLFYEASHTSNEPDLNGVTTQSVGIASIGLGLRANYSKDFFARMDYALVVDGDKTPTSGTRNAGDLFMHVSAGWIW